MPSLVLTTHQVSCWKSISFFQKVVPQLKFVISSLPTDFGLIFWAHSICHTWEPTQGASRRVGRGVCLLIGALRMPAVLMGGILAGGLPVESWKQSAGFSNALWYSYLPLSSCPLILQSWLSLLQYCGYSWREMGFSSSFPYSWGSLALFTTHLFSPKRGCHQLVQPCAVSPWGRDRAGWFLSPSPKYPNLVLFFVFAPVECWNSPSGRLDLYEFSLILDGCPSEHSPGFPQLPPRAVGAGSPAPAGSQTAQRSVFLLTDAQLGETPSRSLDIWCLIPQLYRHTFVHKWMLVFGCKKGDRKEEYIMPKWCRHQFELDPLSLSLKCL